MSQTLKCELTRRTGAKTKTHIVFIKPGLERDRAFFMPDDLDLSKPGITRTLSIKMRMIPIRKLSKESTLLMNNRRFGGGITPPDRSSSECAPHLLRGFFYRPSRPINPPLPPSLPPTHRNT